MSEAMYAAANLYNDTRYFSDSEIRIRNNRIKRQKIVRRQFTLLFAFLTLIIFISIFIGTTLLSDAQSDDFVPEFKYYKSVTVHTGDNIWSIASDYYSPEHYDNMNAYVFEICNLNRINKSDNIKSGENLIIPYYSTEFK